MVGWLLKLRASYLYSYLNLWLRSRARLWPGPYGLWGTPIHKVCSLKFSDFQTLSPLYALKQYNDVIKTIDVHFCLEHLPPPYSIRTLWMIHYKRYAYKKCIPRITCKTAEVHATATLKMIMNCFAERFTEGRRWALLTAGTTVTITNLHHTVGRTWTCAKSELRLCSMKLCSNDNHYTTELLFQHFIKLHPKGGSDQKEKILLMKCLFYI